MEKTLDELGFEEFYLAEDPGDRIYARVTREHKERYTVLNTTDEYEAEISGSLRFMASSRSDFPAVGDWVLISTFDEGNAVIHKVMPRKSLLERRSVDGTSGKQILASNIDITFIMQALDRDFNIHRLERYVALVEAGRIEPVILLSKSDLIDREEVHKKVQSVQGRLKIPTVVPFSNESGEGIRAVRALIRPGKTFCIVGSSGVGKSTLINGLAGQSALKTKSLSDSTGKGRHTTTHRELIFLPGGGILIDTPGMREAGVTDNSDSLERTFKELHELASGCRFGDCTHTDEPGCAVREAIRKGEFDPDILANYKKLSREASRFQSSVMERRKKDKKTGKLYKQIIKERKNWKY